MVGAALHTSLIRHTLRWAVLAPCTVPDAITLEHILTTRNHTHSFRSCRDTRPRDGPNAGRRSHKSQAHDADLYDTGDLRSRPNQHPRAATAGWCARHYGMFSRTGSLELVGDIDFADLPLAVAAPLLLNLLLAMPCVTVDLVS